MPAMDNAYALIVGIADYLHIAGLPEAVRNDARDVRDLLADPRHGGYPPEHVTLLLDEQATRAGKVLVVFDCCHAGGIGRPKDGTYVLPGAANSLFTGHLLAGLKGGVPGADGLVRVFDLFEYVQPRVTRRTFPLPWGCQETWSTGRQTRSGCGKRSSRG
jgi:hypothetical protein